MNAGWAILMFVALALAVVVCLAWNQYDAEQEAKEEHIKRSEGRK